METAIAFAGKSVAVPAISFILRKAFDYLDKYRKSQGMEELKNRLLLAMPKIQAVFDVVNPDHVREQSPALDAWLWQLRDAVEDAENAVDELEYYELEEKADERKISDWGSSLAKWNHKVVRSVKNVSIVDKTLKNFAHRDTLKRLKKAVEGLDRSAAEVVGFLAIADRLKGSASSSQLIVNNDRETSSELSASKFVGREQEMEKIIGWITKTPIEAVETVRNTNSLSIISVVGHGGMGKTTLAQNICNEHVVRNHFQVIWVTVSTHFDATSVTSKILESLTGAKPSSDHLEPLQKNLKENLKSKIFLLVLDDVWEDKKEGEWAKLFAPLRNVNIGSKILLTTRMRSVADMATSVMGVEGGQCLTLQGLEDTENIELFNHHVSSGLDPQDWEHFRLVGEQIARKLGGCPLVTKVVAGHMRGNMMIEYWNRFLHEGLTHLNGTEEGIMRVLRLSYYSLPTELQICFRYCCIFPQDYQFKKQELVQMWMGSGIISEHVNDSQTFEDIGEQILVQLSKKSFFDLRSRLNSFQGTKEEYYVMHDLMHDLARNVSAGECARITQSDKFEKDNRTVRHMYIANIGSFSVDEVKRISDFKYLRTIIIDTREAENDVYAALERVVESLMFLRLFCSRETGECDQNIGLTGKWGKLKHLRYLRLEVISPKGLCGVTRLYHLMLFDCDRDHYWQSGAKEARYLGNLDRLRYVQLPEGYGEFSVVRLTQLQDYSYYVEESIGKTLSLVKSLRVLRTLGISGLENVTNPEKAKDVKLNEIISLKSLSLRWSVSGNWSGEPNNMDELVLDNLEPHFNVKELEILGYRGVKLPFWIEDLSIKNLVSLKLYCCFSWEHLPSLGKLVWLRHIKLERLRKLERIGHFSSNSSMEFFLPPRLETLEVFDCPILSELPVLPPSLMFLRITEVGLTKLPMIDRESSRTKPSQLVTIKVESCCSLTSLKESFLDQKVYMEALLELNIKHCHSLESGSIAFEGMNRLMELSIIDCPMFSTKGTMKGEFTYLSQLTLTDCSGFVSLPSADVFMSFKSLFHMKISRCNNLLSLGGLGSIPSLYYLRIDGCSKLAEVGSAFTPHASSGGEEDHLVQISTLFVDRPSLLLVEPLSRLRRTKELEIVPQIGPQVERLPERWLIQNRQFLQCLSIYGAHRELVKEIRENSNSESNKVSHIPRAEIVQSRFSQLEGDWFSIMGKECDRYTYFNLRYEDNDVLTSWVNQANDDNMQ